MIAGALDFAKFSVQQKALVGIEGDGADAKFRFGAVNGFAAARTVVTSL
jgi:hypothetical protein